MSSANQYGSVFLPMSSGMLEAYEQEKTKKNRGGKTYQ